MVGDYAAWDYFQSIDRPENREFVRKFKAVHGQDRATSDVIEAAYFSVHLSAQAVVEAQSAEVSAVRKSIRRQSLNAPEGIVSVDNDTQHPGGLSSLVKFRRTVSLIWSGLRKNLCGLTHILTLDHVRNGIASLKACTRPGEGGRTLVHAKPRAG